MRALFWISSALIVWTQALYAPALALLRRAKGSPPVAPSGEFDGFVSLVVAAYNEEAVIEAKVRNALALDWPRERLEVIVAVDGAGDATAATRPRGRAPTSCSSCPAAARSARRTRRCAPPAAT